MKKSLKWPSFKNDNKVAEWLDKTDFSDYLDPSDLQKISIADLLQSHNSKPKTKKITIRIPEDWIKKTKDIASQMDIPYQSLMKQFIHKGLNENK